MTTLKRVPESLTNLVANYLNLEDSLNEWKELIELSFYMPEITTIMDILSLDHQKFNGCFDLNELNMTSNAYDYDDWEKNSLLLFVSIYLFRCQYV